MNEHPFPKPTKPRKLLAFYVLLTVIGVIGFLGAIRSAVVDARVSDQRESDRVASDVASCERGNDNRETNRRIAQAQRDYVDETVERIADFADLDREERRVLADLLRPARVAINDAIDEIENIDCSAVVLGAQEEP